jgi:large subunit ribosomal protein L3
MGHDKVTLQNLTIAKVDSERELLLIKGNVPGPKKGFVVVKTAVKAVK